MKANEHRFVIDELRICYLANNADIHRFENVEVGGHIEIGDFSFYRILNDRFRYCFDILMFNEQVAQLKFGHYTDNEDEAIHAYFKVMNPIFYNPKLLQTVLKLPDTLGFIINNITSIDIAFDACFNIPSLVKKMMRDAEVTTIINGKAVQDRKKILSEIYFEYSTNLERLKHPTITIKQRKAQRYKNAGIVVQTYDKLAEIENSSDKQYILDYYQKPKRLYRMEVRLPYQELKDYFGNRSISPTTDMLLDSNTLKAVFLYHLSSVIRFTRNREKIRWTDLLRM